ncbi:MAG: TrkH family potassium uptake protein [Clostridiales bacterium]|nr:TrkH family potassium uptake protein [Candidatus Equinaster intestinalis]
MNKRMIFSSVGMVLMFESALLVLPIITSLIYGEKCVFAFLITAVGAFLAGLLIKVLSRPKTHVIYAKEGFVIVAFTWIVLSLVGALPFVLSGEIPSYADAFFETVSGFTTTGASVVTNVEELSHGVLFWRSFTHFIGGMGILVFVMAIMPKVSDRPMHILRAEMPGPVIGKVVPKARETAKILYLIYIAVTLLEAILLSFGDMSIFESLLHALGTAGTGGFGLKADSIVSYSAYTQWVITIFMYVFSVNFNLYYLLLIRNFRSALSSRELWFFFGVVAASVGVITINIYSIYGNTADSVRHSAFQVATVLSTTGYSSADFNTWPLLSKTLLVCLMFMGGCAGSTAGGIKASRILMMFKIIGKEIRRAIHPRSVDTVRMDGKSVDNATVRSVTNYFLIYFVCFIAIFLLLGFEPFDFETNFTATTACFNNIGPGLGMVGPMGSYSGYSVFSKVLLSFAMLFGRLEIFPMIVIFVPSTWKKNK